MSSKMPVWAGSTNCTSGLAGKIHGQHNRSTLYHYTGYHLTLRFEVTTKSDAASLNKMREERDIHT
jgi:hypothetical protein